MKLFVNTVTKECGMYDPSDLDDGNWIEAPKGTQAVYVPNGIECDPIHFYKIKDGVLLLWCEENWYVSTYTPELLTKSRFMTHLWGTLPDFEF